MRNLKKLLSVIVVVAMMVTVMMPAFAAEGTSFTYTAEAQKLNDLGLYKGISTETFDPDLGTALNRETGVVMLLRIFGLEAEAAAITDADATLAKFTDAASISSWAKNAVAYAVKNGLVQGYPDGTFGSKVALNGKAYATLILRQLGFTPDYNNATTELADKGGLTPEEATLFAGKELVKDDLVGMSFGTLSATDKDGKTVIETLVAEKVVDETAAVDAGLVTPAATPTPAPVAVALDLDTASSINSKIVEVKLATAAKTEDVAAATFKVADAAAKEIAVTSAALAAYDTDSKTVLVTLEADTAAGTLYTLTCGTESVKFGGKAVDSTKPEVSKIESTEYNKVKITFTEAIKLDSVTVTLAEKYGTKAALEIKETKYSGRDAIEFTTGDQKAVLYGSVISGVTDFAGNTMDKVEDKTFVGKAADTNALKVTGAYGQNNPEEVTVQFNVRVDEATLATTAFKVEESYGTKAVLTVTGAKIGAKDDTNGLSGAKLTDNVTLATDAKKHVVLTVPGTKNSVLYKVTATGLKSVYGKDLSSTASETYATFVGKAKPTDTFAYATPVATSNTTIEVKFDNKVDETLAETVANYTITESYGTKAALAVSVAELQSDGKTVKLTVATMKGVLYKMAVANIKDIYGNAMKTGTDAEKTFVGKAVAAKITKVTAKINTSDNTVLELTFDVNVGSAAADVSHYTIDKGIGYPNKAEIDADNKALVKLTIPKTVDGDTYKVTVKGLENADGVAMDAAGVETTFTGKGVDATLPNIEGVFAVDNQTLKIYFDRSVTHDSVKGKIWSGTAAFGNLTAGALLYSINGADPSTALNTLTHFAYQDAADSNVLVVRVASNDAFKAATGAATTLKLKGLTTKVKNTSAIEFAPNTNEPANPEVVNVVALDKRTLRVYFSEKVEDISKTANFTASTFKISSTDASQTNVTTSAVAVAVASVKKIDDITYDLTLDRVLDSSSSGVTNGSVYLRIATAESTVETAAQVAKLQDYTQIVELKKDDTSKAYEARQFGVSSTAAETVISSGINVFMPNKRTIEVYWPESMNSTHVTTTGNFKIYTASSAGAELNATDKFVAEYDSDARKTTIYLKNDIAASATSEYYMEFNTGIKSEDALRNIQKSSTDATALRLQFAAGTVSVTKPTIASAAVSDDKMKLTITMTEKVAFGAASNPTLNLDSNNSLPDDEFATASTIADDTTNFSAADLCDIVTINAQFVDESSADKVVPGDISGTVTRNKDGKTFVVTFVKALKASTNGTVTTEVSGTPTIYMYNMNYIGADRTADAADIGFGVSTTTLYDTTKPVLLSAQFKDEFVGSPLTSPTAGHDGKLDTAVLYFSEDMASVDKADVALALGTAYSTAQAGKDYTVTVSGSTLTVLFTATDMLVNTGLSAGGGAVLTITLTDGKVKDLAGNELAEDDGTDLTQDFVVTSNSAGGGNPFDMKFTDKAAPIIATAVLGNEGAGAAANFQDNDILEFTFSETVNTVAGTFATDATPTFAELNALFTFSGGALTDMTFDTTDDITGAGATGWSLQAAGNESVNVITTAHTITPKVADTVQIRDAAGNYLVPVAVDVN